ncbi:MULTISPECIES: hypothetical protein [Cryobacterium]|uniref:Uncharacterized protein n=1 Tax=Cryobacterium levicorallinum TaxID=995038 RepID=A0A1I3AWH6_9MICO|nr:MULTISPECIES: hypothetical protein [Cryobacterium]TFB87929.1 hypothetical protein E3O11_02265 [Cryobacterium levicorallinum]TFD56445.1 hypothetical protein E3T41_14665 [Cryobacterium sp. Hh38]GEP26890.1 hypothetical protein CLE01_14880 [Cryobacterium levicorallinum]SFH54468.1 hypothetical protein SAMN05216274_107181 [Cryobacterium levicorallinum]
MNPKMTAKKRWIAMGAGSALGIGLLAGGAVTAANAFEIEDSSGSSIGVQPVSSISTSTAIPFSTASVSTFDDSVSLSSDDSSNTSSNSSDNSSNDTSNDSSSGSSTVSVVSAVSAVSVVSVVSVVTPVSAPSVASPVSAASVASPASPASVQSPASVD